MKIALMLLLLLVPIAWADVPYPPGPYPTSGDATWTTTAYSIDVNVTNALSTVTFPAQVSGGNPIVSKHVILKMLSGGGVVRIHPSNAALASATVGFPLEDGDILALNRFQTNSIGLFRTTAGTSVISIMVLFDHR